MTHADVKRFFKRTSSFIESVGVYDKEENNVQEFDDVLKIEYFNELDNDPFYKFISDETLKHLLLNGQFQFGSIEYYRNC